MNKNYEDLGVEIGELVRQKQKEYGDSANNAGEIMKHLYPLGIGTHQYTDALLIVRILDKLNRIAQRGPDGRDRGGESPFKDIAGYGLLGWDKDETRVRQEAALPSSTCQRTKPLAYGDPDMSELGETLLKEVAKARAQPTGAQVLPELYSPLRGSTFP